MVDGGHSICMSFEEGFGTYFFDTVELTWRKVGDWVLPFEGEAEYSHDFNLWLGFSSESPHHLCWTSELSAMAMEKPPELQHVWQDLVAPENWVLTNTRLVNLGSGRFCIARHFEIINRAPGELGYYDYMDVECQFAVLTGVEIGGGPEGLKALKHKSILYEFIDDGGAINHLECII